METIIDLIRHGEPSWAQKGRFVQNAPLSELGRAQAERLRPLYANQAGIELFEAYGYEPGRYGMGTDPRVATLTTSAFGYWLRGDLVGSLARADRATELAASLDHPLSLAYARFHKGLLHIWRGEPEVVRGCALGVLKVAERRCPWASTRPTGWPERATDRSTCRIRRPSVTSSGGRLRLPGCITRPDASSSSRRASRSATPRGLASN